MPVPVPEIAPTIQCHPIVASELYLVIDLIGFTPTGIRYGVRSEVINMALSEYFHKHFNWIPSRDLLAMTEEERATRFPASEKEPIMLTIERVSNISSDNEAIQLLYHVREDTSQEIQDALKERLPDPHARDPNLRTTEILQLREYCLNGGVMYPILTWFGLLWTAASTQAGRPKPNTKPNQNKLPKTRAKKSAEPTEPVKPITLQEILGLNK